MSTRRAFLQTALASTALGTVGRSGGAAMPGMPEDPGSIPRFTLTTISGAPRSRGRLYGERFGDAIRAFLDRELYGAFIGQPAPKDAMLRYAGACGRAIRAYSAVIHDELEGMAEGSGLRVEELVLITLHEELYHKGALPKVPHCTAVAIGPPETAGRTYVGQTWDWMTSVAGLSTVVRWERPEGPDLLAYGFPGLWAGAGLNSAGLALCWTSADLGNTAQGARVGIPSYVLLTHFLYQESLEAVAEEARRATHAGWFTFVLGDGEGNLLNVEGSPDNVAVERHRGRLVRVGFGTRAMTRTPDGQDVPPHDRCRTMADLIAARSGRVDRADLQGWFQDPDQGICVGPSTIDMMVFDTTSRRALLSRGPSYGVSWQEFGFDGPDSAAP